MTERKKDYFWPYLITLTCLIVSVVVQFYFSFGEPDCEETLTSDGTTCTVCY